MFSTATRLLARPRAFVVAHPISVHWGTLVVLMVLASTFPEVGASTFVVATGLLVAGPLLWRLLSERMDNHRLRAELKEVEDTLRAAVDDVRSSR